MLDWILVRVLFSGKFCGWRSLVGYSPWDRKESNMTEQLHFTSRDMGDFIEFSWVIIGTKEAGKKKDMPNRSFE